MKKLFEEFAKPSYADWVAQLEKDLKGASPELIQRKDLIEEFDLTSYQHQDSVNTSAASAFENPYVRGVHAKDNQWENLATILVTDEESANKKALMLLNLGATALRFECTNDNIDFTVLTKEIQLEYIQTTFAVTSIQAWKNLLKNITPSTEKSIFFELDWNHVQPEEWKEIAAILKQKQTYTLVCNGYALQQLGATTWQEIAYILSSANEYITRLLENGLTIDEAAACIHINVGAGAKYFYEIAKVRALKVLWSKMIEAYQPASTCTYAMKITGIVGFTNKSLKDPHTNLLRQTTEAMAMAMASVGAICVQPYDSYSTKGSSNLTTRMAVNIPLILQEESYLNKVIDPLAGSYTTELLTNTIADKAWNLFQTLENLGGLTSSDALNLLTSSVSAKAEMRKLRIEEKVDTLIGVNIFPNPQTEENEWIERKSYLGLAPLTLESSI